MSFGEWLSIIARTELGSDLDCSVINCRSELGSDLDCYELRVAADCRVQGRDWTLPGVAHLQAQLAVAPDILTHLPLNITTLIPQELLQSRLEHPDWQALPQVEDITLEKLNARLPSWSLETVGRRSSFRWVVPLSFLSPVALVVAGALLLR